MPWGDMPRVAATAYVQPRMTLLFHTPSTGTSPSWPSSGCCPRAPSSPHSNRWGRFKGGETRPLVTRPSGGLYLATLQPDWLAGGSVFRSGSFKCARSGKHVPLIHFPLMRVSTIHVHIISVHPPGSTQRELVHMLLYVLTCSLTMFNVPAPSRSCLTTSRATTSNRRAPWWRGRGASCTAALRRACAWRT